MHENFSARLIKALKESPKNQTEIAAEAGLTSAYLSDLKLGKRINPSPAKVKSLADALGVELSWLYAGELPMEPDLQRQKTLDLELERAKRVIPASDKRLEALMTELQWRLEYMQTANPHHTQQLMKECHRRIDEFGEWIVDLKEEPCQES